MTIDLSIFEQDDFQEWLVKQRWFGSKTRDVSHIEVAECIPLREEPPELALALIEARFGEGTHETYQVVIGSSGYDMLGDPACGRELLHRMRSGSEVTVEEGTCASAGPSPPAPASAGRST